MTDGSAKGFWMSATLHGSVAALLFFGFVLNSEMREEPKVFELVAGEGDNFMAREAPALGAPGGVKLDVPTAPDPKPAPPEPVQQDVTPPAPTPPVPKPKVVTPAPPKTTEQAVPDFKKKLVREVIKAESKAKREIKKERDAEKKRLEDEKKRMTKEEFDRSNKAKTTTPPAKNAPTKIAKIDAEGIAKGVVGGSVANKVGGAGGKALKNENDDVLAAYFKYFKDELRRRFEPPPGLGESLKATFEVRSNADGTFSNARIVKGSGSKEFDDAVLEAIRRVKLPPRQDRKSETIEFDFTMRERGEG